jgi:hypothetical protein
MTDLSRPTEFLEGGRIAVYTKAPSASIKHNCDANCGRAIQAGENYLRVQYVRTDKGEDLTETEQARGVDYRRRVVLKFHFNCAPEGIKR